MIELVSGEVYRCESQQCRHIGVLPKDVWARVPVTPKGPPISLLPVSLGYTEQLPVPVPSGDLVAGPVCPPESPNVTIS
jgi:hypothetical protein